MMTLQQQDEVFFAAFRRHALRLLQEGNDADGPAAVAVDAISVLMRQLHTISAPAYDIEPAVGDETTPPIAVSSEAALLSTITVVQQTRRLSTSRTRSVNDDTYLPRPGIGEAPCELFGCTAVQSVHLHGSLVGQCCSSPVTHALPTAARRASDASQFDCALEKAWLTVSAASSTRLPSQASTMLVLPGGTTAVCYDRGFSSVAVRWHFCDDVPECR